MIKIKNKSMVIILLVIVFVMLSGCAKTKEPPVEGSEEGTTAEIIVYNDIMSITLPTSWENKYVADVTDDSIALYQKAAYESIGAGWLCTFKRYVNDDEYKNLPQYEVLSSGAEADASSNEILNDFIYIIEYPSDVQGDYENDKSMEEYNQMFKDLEGIKNTFKLEDDA